MAQTQQQQQQQDQQQSDQTTQSSASDDKVLVSDNQTVTKQVGNIKSVTSSTKVEQNLTKGKPERLSIRKSSTSSTAASKLAAGETIQAAQQALGRYQPSKVFLTKCKAELETLLESIKKTYHDEVKELYTSEQEADLFVDIDEEFRKPLHRCILVARAFKLYSTLKAFKVDNEQDIIISDFQNKINEEALAKRLAKLGSADKSKEDQEREEEEEKERKKKEALAIFHCSLPSELISSELLLSFVRRLYLDTDTTDDEITINKRLIDWIKLNKPELVRPSPSAKLISPDHRESFRTVQPDYQELSIINSPPPSTATMSPDHNLQHTPRSSVVDADESQTDDQDETSQAFSFKDDNSLIGSSLLTRTETFELIPKSQDNNSKLHASSSHRADDLLATDTFSDTGDENNDSEISKTSSAAAAAYTPTTRTGLKPKTFTTPVDAKQRLARASSKQAALLNQQQQANAPKTPEAPQPKPRVAAAARTSLAAKQSTPTNATKANSGTGKPVASSTPRGTTVKASLPIARAHPISMERSQSPATSSLIISKGSTKNFIAANKRLVSQIDTTNKRAGASPNADLSSATTNDGGDLSEADTNLNSDISWKVFEQQLTCDNMVAQMDKFALISLSTLADCLAKMFIGEILTDSTILVRGGKEINAHKCILAARSAYLNDFVHSQTNKQQRISSTSSLDPAKSPEPGEHSQVGGKLKPLPPTPQQMLKIDLSEFSYNVVYFSMLHIYSGIAKVPEDLDMEELTKLSHQLHVSTLNQVCQQNLRMNYCHFFHKPCPTCSVGVLKTLPLAWRYDYSDLYSKCLQWIGSHFANVFCLKEFSELKPGDLIEECYSATMSQLTPDNIISRTIECQKLLKNLPRVKWTESIICLVGRLLEDFCHYVAENYEKILQSESFMNLGKNCWECEVLEENLLAAMNHLRPDSGCKTLIQLHKIECQIESYCEDPKNVSDSFTNLILKMRKYCERYLLKEATAVVHCNSWRLVNPALQKRIKDQAILSTDFDEPTKQLASKPKLPSSNRLTTTTSGQPSNEGTKSPSNRSTPDSKLKSPSATYLPPPKNKVAAARHLKVLK